MELKECFTKECFLQMQILRIECEKVFNLLNPIIEERFLFSLNEGIKRMKLAENPVLSDDDMKKIEDYRPYLNFSNFSNIKENVFENILKEANKLDKFFEEYRNKEDDLFDKKMDGFNKLQSFHQFMSIWSIYEISPKDMDKPFSKDIVESVSYGGNSIEVNKKVSWLEMWALGDKLMQMSEDNHHVFIEDFYPDKSNPRKYNMSTGS